MLSYVVLKRLMFPHVILCSPMLPYVVLHYQTIVGHTYVGLSGVVLC